MATMVPTYIPGLFFTDDGPNVDSEIMEILNDAEERIAELFEGRRVAFNLGTAASAASGIADEIVRISEHDETLSDNLQDHYAMLSSIGMIGVFVHDLFDEESYHVPGGQLMAFKRKPLVYVAGPYSADTPEGIAVNVRSAVAWGDNITMLGAAVIVPHLTHHWDAMFPHDYEFWMQLDFQHLARCDAIFVIASSPGVEREVAFAKEQGIPVFRNPGRLVQWLEAGRHDNP